MKQELNKRRMNMKLKRALAITLITIMAAATKMAETNKTNNKSMLILIKSDLSNAIYAFSMKSQ